MKLGDYLNAINTTKSSLMNGDEFAEKKYAPYVINRCLSYYPDIIRQVNFVNQHSHLDKKMQFDFLVGVVRKSKRYNPWMKEKLPDDIEAVKEYFGYSNQKAKEALEILTEKDLESIRAKIYKGGC